MSPFLVLFTLAQSGIVGPEVTVYNQGFGFVKEVRSVDLKAGRQTVAITDVPSQIDVTSVAIRSLSRPTGLHVLEQNYQYDLVSTEAILEKSVGARIRLLRHFGSQAETLEGTLISAPTALTPNSEGGKDVTYNGMVVKLDDGNIVLNPEGEVEVLGLPEGLISLPTLLWDLESDAAGSNRVELSYITQGMKWEANYVLTLDEPSRKGALQGWVSVNNETGTTFHDATLKLLAGDVHVATPTATMNQGLVMAGEATVSLKRPQMTENQLFEYHIYTLQRPATLKNKEIKQLSLLEAAAVPYRKRLIIDAMGEMGAYYPNEGEIATGDVKAKVKIEFTNDKKSELGLPFPAGKFRIYQRDASGSVQLLGEDRIEHTPRNEKVSLTVGQAFDVVATRKRLSYKRLSKNRFEETFEVRVRNRKATSETVEVLERHYGDWHVSNASDAAVKEDANTMRFVLNLKPNGVHTVKYTVTTKW